MSMAKTGILAPQFMKGTTSIVVSRSFSSRMVRVAITPGTAQPPAMPPDTIMARMLLPCSPKMRSTRSRTKAMRAT